MNDVIATGHMMRCLAIADAAAELGTDTMFLLADEQAVEMIRQRGYQTIVLHSRWDDLDAELNTLRKVIAEYKMKTLLIDSYMVTHKYLQLLSEQIKTVYLDDLNAFVYPVHVLICYAVYWEKFCYPQNYRKTRLLLGLSYTPLRKAFRSCGKKEIRAEAQNLLILSGGADRYHILQDLLPKIRREKYRHIVVICGNYFRDYETLQKQYGSCGTISIYKSVPNIEDYMKQADLAVSAGGTTLYELCACGTPTISYSFADNQLENVRQFQQEGVIDYAGDARDMDISGTVNLLLEKYFGDPCLRRMRSEKMQALLDGLGAERIARTLLELDCGQGR